MFTKTYGSTEMWKRAAGTKTLGMPGKGSHDLSSSKGALN